METGRSAHGSLKAVLIGSVIDQGGSWMLGGIVGGVLSVVLGGAMPGARAEELQDYVAGSVPLTLAFVISGAAFSFIGAYVAARIAPDSPSVHALAVGLLGIAVPAAYEQQLPPRWAQIVSTVLIIALSLLAARIARPRSGRAEPPELPPPAPPPVPILARQSAPDEAPHGT